MYFYLSTVVVCYSKVHAKKKKSKANKNLLFIAHVFFYPDIVFFHPFFREKKQFFFNIFNTVKDI